MFKVITRTYMKIMSLLLVKVWGSEYFVHNKSHQANQNVNMPNYS